MIPWFPIISGIAAALGVGGLVWYQSLPSDQKAIADGMARDLAMELFNKKVEQLTDAQARQVRSRVEAYFTN